jgi:hypothetical protein
MLKRINSIIAVFVSVLFLSGCSTAKIPMDYRFNPRNVKKEVTGSWIEINLFPTQVLSPEIKLSGELIAIQSDTVYILTEVQLRSILINEIFEATLYIYTNQAGKYALATGLLYFPDILAAIADNIGGFLAIGVPWVLAGSIITLSVGNNDSNLLIYPGRNQIEDFRKFARFPKGMPPGIEKERLHLLVTK